MATKQRKQRKPKRIDPPPEVHEAMHDALGSLMDISPENFNALILAMRAAKNDLGQLQAFQDRFLSAAKMLSVTDPNGARTFTALASLLELGLSRMPNRPRSHFQR